MDYFLASGVSGLLTSTATNPIWVIKTRMVSSDASSQGAYPSMWAGAKDLWVKEGWRGFFRGLGANCLGVSHGAVQFAVYDPLKRSWLRYVAKDGREIREDGATGVKLGNEATLIISGSAKVVAGTATYPYQVVRSRLQTYDAEERFGKGIRGVVGKLWREEGVRGFYKGLGPNFIRVMPATWVTFLVYENVRYYLPWWTA
jgi:solute carrier family 25 (mitochondrial folate transporter), member 32